MKKDKKKLKKKLILDKYKQDIYPPYNLYVMANHNVEDISNRFVWDDGASIDPVELDNYQGVTYGLVYHKEDKAHEAFHVVFRILHHCNIDLCECTNEPYAFLQGWATKCIYETYKKCKK
jgi:hypothetical protein